MNQRFALDVPSLQKLLEAAWVLQCQRDRELGAAWVFQSQDDREPSRSPDGITVLAVPSDKDELTAALPMTLPGNVLEPARAVAEAHTPQIQISEIINPNVVPNPLTVAPIYQRAEVAGALALADPNRLRDLIPLPTSDISQEAARGKNETAAARTSRRVTLHLVWFGDEYRVGLRLVPFRDQYKGKEHALARRTASVFKQMLRDTAAYAGPVVVLAIMLAFLFTLLGSHRPALTALNAAAPAPKIAVDDSPARDYVGRAEVSVTTGSEHQRTDLRVLAPAAVEPAVPEPNVPGPHLPEPSHQRVTDPAASSLVAGLSRYEMKSVRHQAQYGDDVAALTLGMAYEIGRHVPQSCAQAAHWVAVAAEEGNSAAQYNLALRYVAGDGTPTNLEQARNWLEKAAGRGYQKAQLTLQASHL